VAVGLPRGSICPLGLLASSYTRLPVSIVKEAINYGTVINGQLPNWRIGITETLCLACSYTVAIDIQRAVVIT